MARTDALVAVLGTLLWTQRSNAQAAPVVTLKPPNATHAAEFTRISSIRELADGRVLIVDRKENRLVVADFRSGKTEPVGRVGGGPGEYRSVGGLNALPADSTIMPDPNARRWLLLHGSRVAATIPAETPVIVATRGQIAGADRSSVLTPLFPAGTKTKPFSTSDSFYLARVERATGRVDSIGRLRSVFDRGRVFGRGAGVEVSVPPLTVGEQALLFADGWTAIVRLDPYRVDWISAEGKAVRGELLPFTPTKVDDSEKRAYRDRLTKEFGRSDMYRDEGWPDFVPPFEAEALLRTPEGRLLIRRMPTASVTTFQCDIVDRRGALVGTISLGNSERIVGFGARSVYVAVTDEDGIQRLRRHPWP